jgi:hypothetical protein
MASLIRRAERQLFVILHSGAQSGSVSPIGTVQRRGEGSQPSSFIVPIPPFRLILCFRMSDKSEIPFSSVCVMSGIGSLEKVIESKNEGRLVMK